MLWPCRAKLQLHLQCLQRHLQQCQGRGRDGHSNLMGAAGTGVRMYTQCASYSIMYNHVLRLMVCSSSG